MIGSEKQVKWANEILDDNLSRLQKDVERLQRAIDRRERDGKTELAENVRREQSHLQAVIDWLTANRDNLDAGDVIHWHKASIDFEAAVAHHAGLTK